MKIIELDIEARQFKLQFKLDWLPMWHTGSFLHDEFALVTGRRGTPKYPDGHNLVIVNTANRMFAHLSIHDRACSLDLRI
jgi:hypothetical protein